MTRSAYADSTPLRLAQLRAGQVRGLRLRLMEIRRNDKRPTEFFLELTIACVLPGRAYHVDVKPDFGESVPRRATMTVVHGRGDAAPPVPLVEEGVPSVASFDLALEPTSEWLTLWVSAEGAEQVPPQLAGELRLRQPEDERPVEELETARLPSLKSVMRQSLMGVLRASSAPSLVLLGGLMRSEDPAEKRTLLRQLVDLGADIRLIDGGVRDIAHCERAVRDFAVVDFESLDLASQADAAVAIFHPGCPLPVVRQCFAVAFERQFSPASPAEGRRWNELVKAAAVVVCRKDRSLLDEGFAVATGIAADASRQALFRSLVEWAWHQASPVVRPLARPVEDYLRRISGEDPVDAERAAIEVMAQYDLIVASVPLG